MSDCLAGRTAGTRARRLLRRRRSLFERGQPPELQTSTSRAVERPHRFRADPVCWIEPIDQPVGAVPHFQVERRGDRAIFRDGFEETFDPSVQYWRIVRAIASDLLGHAVRPGIDFALTEIVRCKSRKEKGVAEAMAECSSRYFEKTLEIAAAPLLIPLGKTARQGVADVAGTKSKIGLYGPIDLVGRDRWVLMLGHPSAGERKKPTVKEISRVQNSLAKPGDARVYRGSADGPAVQRVTAQNP